MSLKSRLLKPKKPETTKPKAAKPPKAPPVAHIVVKGGLAKAKAGEAVASLCGVVIKGDPKPGAGVCQDCFVKQLDTDDGKVETEQRRASARATETANTRYTAGLTSGRNEGRRMLEAELAATARTQAEEARRQAEAPRYEDLGKALKLKLVDGGEATVRKNRVAAVQLLQNGPNYAVVVDGHAVHVGTEETLAKRHYDDLHEKVFGTTEVNQNQTQGVSA